MNELDAGKFHEIGRFTLRKKDFRLLTADVHRFIRLTNALLKKIENYACAVALHSMYYNFMRLGRAEQ